MKPMVLVTTPEAGAMEPSLAINTAAVLLGIGALGGIVMALIRFKGAPRPPSTLAMIHGLLGAAGLTLLIYIWATLGLSHLGQAGTVVLVFAAVAGMYINLRYHSQMQPLPISLVIAHAVVAVLGFGLLLGAISRAHRL